MGVVPWEMSALETTRHESLFSLVIWINISIVNDIFLSAAYVRLCSLENFQITKLYILPVPI